MGQVHSTPTGLLVLGIVVVTTVTAVDFDPSGACGLEPGSLLLTWFPMAISSKDSLVKVAALGLSAGRLEQEGGVGCLALPGQPPQPWGHRWNEGQQPWGRRPSASEVRVGLQKKRTCCVFPLK